jgi:LIVCS family branched-chain amino acid:cation transporter
MKKLNPLKIGKYTFWVSFILGNIFLFGFLFGEAIGNRAIAFGSAIAGYFYLFIATAVNLIILLALAIWGIYDINKRKDCFTGTGIILINIPVAIIYAYLGILLFGFFSKF